MNFQRLKLSNWSNSVSVFSRLVYPKNIKELQKIVKNFIKKKTLFSIMGSGQTYGDSFLNHKGNVINISKINRIKKIDYLKNYVELECGVKLNEILSILLKKNRIINNLPGSHRVTIGGCIASNVHGKDSFNYGTFGNNIISLKILDETGNILEVSSKSSKFKKYVGSYGLNSIIISAKIKIKKINSNSLMIQTFKFSNIKELENLFIKKEKYSYYMGAWVDHFSSKGRGIFKCAIWQKKTYLKNNFNKDYNFLSKVLINLFYPILKFFNTRLTIKYLNYIFFSISKNNETKIMPFIDFYFPQEKYIPKHSLLYREGKINIQCMLPKKSFEKNFLKIANLSKKYSYESWWMGIKKHKKSKFNHSFTMDGYDLTLQWSKNFINSKNFDVFFLKLINFFSKNNIIIYLSKDILLNKKKFMQLENSKIFKKYFLSKNKIFNNLMCERLK